MLVAPDLYRIGLAFVDAFIGSYKKPPKKIILDIDDTDDAIHGSQQLSLFNAHYNEYCFMPLHLYEGHTGKLITTILRPAEEFEGKSPLRFSDVYSIAYDKPGRRFKSSCVAIPTSAHLPFTTSVMNMKWISFWDRPLTRN